MRRTLLLSLTLLLLLSSKVWGLSGVGALADRLSSGGTITLKGKTSPWAEVVLVDPVLDDQVVVAAEVEQSGDFTFSFNSDSVAASRLEIFGVDEVGITSRVKLTEVSGVEVLLPPTIVNDEEDTSTTRLALLGYTYPGSEVELSLLNDQDFADSFLIDADTNGEWKVNESGLPAGKYTGKAKSKYGSLESEWSQEIYFEITVVEVPEVVTKVTTTIVGALPVPTAIKELLQERPGDVARVLAPLAAAPIIGLWLKDLIALLLRLILGLLHLFGWKKDRRSWGVVYDSVTKQRLGRVIVRLYELGERRLVETDVTGTEGVFAFLPQAGRYFIKVVRAGYKFPSELVEGSGRDGEYESVYHGEEFEIRQSDEEVRLSIPVDPTETEVNWWFFTKRVLSWLWLVVGWILLVVGLILALLALNTEVSWLNLLAVGFYLGLLLWQVRDRILTGRQWGIVRDSVTGDPVPGVSVALYEVEFNRLVQRRVSNERGRFLLVVPEGKYRLEVAATDWAEDVEMGKSKGDYHGEELEVKGQGNRAIRVKIWVKRK